MSNLFTQVVEGYTKEQAMENVEGLEIVRNATTAWKNAGEPTFNSDKFNVWAEGFMAKHKMTTGAGAYIIKEAGIKDSRQRPYKVINHKQEGKSSWRTVYNVYEITGCSEKENLVKGDLVDVADMLEEDETEIATKARAAEIMKQLTTENKASYGLYKEKQTTDEQEYPGLVMECIYTPSTSAKVGEYYVFGIVR